MDVWLGQVSLWDGPGRLIQGQICLGVRICHTGYDCLKWEGPEMPVCEVTGHQIFKIIHF
jgi:hypothetical protein